MSKTISQRLTAERGVMLGAIAVAIALGWAYASAGRELWTRWNLDPAYGHGFFVPLFSLFLLWRRREMVPSPIQGNLWAGSALIGSAIALRFASQYYYYALLDPLSIVPMAAGICVLLTGWQGFRWAWQSILFLAFMVPLPGRLADMMSHPLQRIATIASTYLVQLLGIPAIAEGNVIVLTHAKIGVIEACNGLRMLILFFAVSTAVAFLVDRPLWFRAILVASAVPIALAANIIRITATAVAHEYMSSEFADWFFHGLAAWLMMPLGILLLYLVLMFLDHAFKERERSRPLTLGAI